MQLAQLLCKTVLHTYKAVALTLKSSHFSPFYMVSQRLEVTNIRTHPIKNKKFPDAVVKLEMKDPQIILIIEK